MKERKIYSAIAALTLLSAAATASTGTINFAGNVQDTTCTVTGLTQTANFPAVTKSELQAQPNYSNAAQAPVNISVVNCPSSLTKGKLTVGFNGSSNRLDLGNTDMRGATVMMGRNSIQGVGPLDIIYKNNVLDVDLIGGDGDITLYPTLVRVFSGDTGASAVIAGDFSTAAQLTMAYE